MKTIKEAQKEEGRRSEMEIKGKGLFPSPFLSLCSFPFNTSRDWPMISILRALYWKEAQESLGYSFLQD